ncbi:hypothetical protein C8F01DRAFT_125093 [Mycena amicta]|nr:hypothetical protein C8F01DRAFT_125093 [Mycena amicta]
MSVVQTRTQKQGLDDAEAFLNASFPTVDLSIGKLERELENELAYFMDNLFDNEFSGLADFEDHGKLLLAPVAVDAAGKGKGRIDNDGVLVRPTSTARRPANDGLVIRSTCPPAIPLVDSSRPTSSSASSSHAGLSSSLGGSSSDARAAPTPQPDTNMPTTRPRAMAISQRPADMGERWSRTPEARPGSIVPTFLATPSWIQKPASTSTSSPPTPGPSQEPSQPPPPSRPAFSAAQSVPSAFGSAFTATANTSVFNTVSSSNPSAFPPPTTSTGNSTHRPLQSQPSMSSSWPTAPVVPSASAFGVNVPTIVFMDEDVEMGDDTPSMQPIMQNAPVSTPFWGVPQPPTFPSVSPNVYNTWTAAPSLDPGTTSIITGGFDNVLPTPSPQYDPFAFAVDHTEPDPAPKSIFELMTSQTSSNPASPSSYVIQPVHVPGDVWQAEAERTRLGYMYQAPVQVQATTSASSRIRFSLWRRSPAHQRGRGKTAAAAIAKYDLRKSMVDDSTRGKLTLSPASSRSSLPDTYMYSATSSPSRSRSSSQSSKSSLGYPPYHRRLSSPPSFKQRLERLSRGRTRTRQPRGVLEGALTWLWPRPI